MLKNVLAVSAALLLFGSSALAQGAAKACVSDIKKLCADVRPGEGRIAACVKDHIKDLSEPCQNLLAKTAAAAKACTADVKQHCADAGRPAAKVVCLKSALVNLSDECKSAVSQIAAGRR
jgi:Skp family chaperone for outer membrane proteins